LDRLPPLSLRGRRSRRPRDRDSDPFPHRPDAPPLRRRLIALLRPVSSAPPPRARPGRTSPRALLVDEPSQALRGVPPRLLLAVLRLLARVGGGDGPGVAEGVGAEKTHEPRHPRGNRRPPLARALLRRETRGENAGAPGDRNHRARGDAPRLA